MNDSSVLTRALLEHIQGCVAEVLGRGLDDMTVTNQFELASEIGYPVLVD